MHEQPDAVDVDDDKLAAVQALGADAVDCFYVANPSGDPVDPDEVIAFAKEQLANFKIPRSVVFVDEFPRNASGKILKRNLT